MDRIAQTLLVGVSIVAIGGCAQLPAQDHSQHGAAAPVAAQPGAGGQAGNHAGDMNKRMKAMHEMREKMAAARTPEERSALMEKRMDMMQSMMEGMMDHKPAAVAR